MGKRCLVCSTRIVSGQYCKPCVDKVFAEKQAGMVPGGVMQTAKPITAVIFEDPAKWLKDEAETVCCLDGVSAMRLPTYFDMDAAVAVTIFDDEEDASKTVTPDDLVEALRKLCGLIDAKKLFVGDVKSAHDLTDACNWDAEVTDAFWQIAYHGEIIYG